MMYSKYTTEGKYLLFEIADTPNKTNEPFTNTTTNPSKDIIFNIFNNIDNYIDAFTNNISLLSINFTINDDNGNKISIIRNYSKKLLLNIKELFLTDNTPYVKKYIIDLLSGVIDENYLNNNNYSWLPNKVIEITQIYYNDNKDLM